MGGRTASASFEGAEARWTDVQVQITGGQPTFNIVGLADKAVAESRERVRAAFAAIGLALPSQRLICLLYTSPSPRD